MKCYLTRDMGNESRRLGSALLRQLRGNKRRRAERAFDELERVRPKAKHPGSVYVRSDRRIRGVVFLDPQR